jgi:hypothetical protein
MKSIILFFIKHLIYKYSAITCNDIEILKKFLLILRIILIINVFPFLLLRAPKVKLIFSYSIIFNIFLHSEKNNPQ